MPEIFISKKQVLIAKPFKETKIDINLDKIEGEVPIMSTYMVVQNMRPRQVIVYLV